jgi:hypothetical protein
MLSVEACKMPELHGLLGSNWDEERLGLFGWNALVFLVRTPWSFWLERLCPFG